MDVDPGAADTGPVLLEREAQLGALDEYADDATHGAGRLVLLAGEAGIGKSALLAAFERRPHDLRVVRGACDGLFTPRPLGPLYDVAATLGGRLQQALESQSSREEIFSLLLRLLGEQPTALLIEDVHWADEATLDLIRYVGRRLAGTSALVVVSYRDDALAATDPLRIVLGELGTQPGTRRIDLPALSPAAVDRLAQRLDLPGAEIHRLTGGNPFFVTELLRDGHPSGSIPPSARDAVLARVARLGDAARRTAEAAALIGSRVEVALLQQVTSATAKDLDELVETGLLVSDPGGLRFRHELTRQAIAQEIPAHRAAPVHAAALAVLVERGGDDARLAYHAEGAGDVQGVQWFAPRAAEHSALLGAHREAVAQFDRALRFTDGLSEAEVAVLWTQRGVECGLVDRWQEASDSLETALDLWRKAGNLLRVGDTLRHLATAHWRLCLPDAGDLAREAPEILRPLGRTPELAWALSRSAVFSPDRTTMVEMARAAAEMAADLGLPDVQSDALNTVACGLSGLDGDWEPPIREALRLAMETRSDAQAGRAFTNYQAFLADAARWDEHDRLAEQGLTYSEEHDIATYSYCMRAGIADSLLMRARWQEARSYAQPLIDLHASPVNIVSPLRVVGLARVRCGDPSGLAHLDEAVLLADQADEREWTMLTRVPRAEARLLLGDHHGATADLLACLDGPLATLDAQLVGALLLWVRRAGLPVPEAPPHLTRPVRDLLEGRTAEAAACWDALGMPYDAAWALVDSGDPEAIREAVQRFDALGTTAAARYARRLLRRLGVASVPQGARASTRANPDGLTTREQEVLALVARGMTDEQIAAQLVLSVRTVHHHVSAVLAKLCVSSRREAAAYAHEAVLAESTP